MREFDRLLKIIKQLRSKNGCRWDRAQRLHNLKSYLLEEVYELVDALDSRRAPRAMEELGDVFLILAFICRLFEEKGKFSARKVLCGINRKLIMRHPHVFRQGCKENKRLASKEAIVKYWVARKAREKGRRTVHERIPRNAPALLMAHILFKEAQYIATRKEAQAIVKEMLEQLSSLRRDPGNTGQIVNGILSLAHLAALNGAEVETLLRAKVLSSARDTAYTGGSRNKR